MTVLNKWNGATRQQQSNANRGSGGSNGGLRTRPPLDYRYDESQRGSCKVLLERLANSDLANKDLDRIKHAKLLNSTYKNSIVDVKSSGYGKLSIIVNSAREANIILNDKSLESMGLRASIPSYFVSCQGVIGGIPIEMSEKEIIDNLVILNNVHKTKTIEARRLDRKMFDKETNKVSYDPSRSILLTFRGRTLPERVAIYSASTNVEPYILPAKICWCCLRYGHVSKHCRSKSRCKRCGESAHTDDSPCPNANSPPKCVHCSGPHLPNSKECPEFIFQQDFRSYVIHNCLTFVEAKAILRPKKPNNRRPTNNYPGLRDDLSLTSAPCSFTPSSQMTFSEALRSSPYTCTPPSQGAPPPLLSLDPQMTKSKLPHVPESANRRKISTPNPSFSHLYNTRSPSSLLNGFALQSHSVPSSPPAISQPPPSSNTTIPSSNLNLLSIIGNLIQMLTNFISATSSGNSLKSEECHNLINSLSSSLSALSSNLLHP